MRTNLQACSNVPVFACTYRSNLATKVDSFFVFFHLTKVCFAPCKVTAGKKEPTHIVDCQLCYGNMSELTKEQLLEYVKKQKLKMKKLETEIASLKEKVEAPVVATVSGGSEEEISTLRLEIETLEKQLSRRDEEISSLSKSIEEAEDEKIQLVAKKNAEIAILQQANESLQSDGSHKSDLLEKVSSLEATITAQRVEIEAYVQSCKEMEFIKSQLDSALAREAAAQAEIVDLNERMDHIKVSTSQLSESNSSYTSQISEFQALITDLQDRLSAFEVGEAALRSELQAREASTIAINEQLSASLEIIVGLKDTIESQKATHVDTNAALASAQTELDATKAKEQSTFAELENAREALQSTQTDLQRIESEMQRTNTELQEKDASLAEVTKRNKDLEGEIEALSKVAPADSPAVSEPNPSASPLVTAGMAFIFTFLRHLHSFSYCLIFQSNIHRCCHIQRRQEERKERQERKRKRRRRECGLFHRCRARRRIWSS